MANPSDLLCSQTTITIAFRQSDNRLTFRASAMTATITVTTIPGVNLQRHLGKPIERQDLLRQQDNVVQVGLVGSSIMAPL